MLHVLTAMIMAGRKLKSCSKLPVKETSKCCKTV